MDSDSAAPIVNVHPVPLSPDILESIQQVFPGTFETVRQQLTQLQHEDPQHFSDRILRCMIFCAWRYPRSTLESWIAQAKTDYRDLIMAAEYDRNDTHLRDLNRPFLYADFSERPDRF